ncbi:Crp/Fnr family transcriptional regulator [Carboxylicivirga sediminis]|uniref:Crp/Fnr family transcriptional regulator n=1 Tax=Carboxylicivirga sediminis TaxID=2006564 RepID=A0A941F3S4_9BACT|nr:Crp/Fnr family transcriptional regulator [Carboxylicivirga sediminis]MBR8536283.1 Crp/Fnr family transcriptional regulator [Carboxylicivirga sediminis]
MERTMKPDRQVFTSFDKCSMYRTGEVVYDVNSKAKTAYLVKKGMVKLFSVGAKGTKQIIRMVREGEIVGYYSQFTNEPEVTGCECMVNSVLCELSEYNLQEAFKTDSNLAFTMLQKACLEMKETCISIMNMSQKTVRARAANILVQQLELFEVEEGNDFPVRISRTDMASWIGTSKESVSRSLNDFMREGLIEMNKETIKVTNLRGLKRVCVIS